MSEVHASREHLWNVYKELGEMEKHFGDLQFRCRTLASTWVLASLAGFGFLITNNVGGFGDLLVFLVGVCASGALFVMWIMDLNIYQKLLDAAFIEGMSLENAQPWLPSIRNNRRELLKGTALGKLTYYYSAAILITSFIGGIGLDKMSEKYSFLHSFTNLGIYTFIVVCLIVVMLKSTSSTKDYEKEIRDERTKAYSEMSVED